MSESHVTPLEPFPEYADAEVTSHAGALLHPDGLNLLDRTGLAVVQTSDWRWNRYQEDQIGTQVSCSGDVKMRVEAWFQPVVSLRRGRVVEIEALARLHDGKDLLTPDYFLPRLNLAEKRALSQQMLQQGVEQLVALDATRYFLNLAVNVEPEFMADFDCMNCLLSTVTPAQISASRISLEMLENGDFLGTDASLVHLRQLREQGISLMLDDIGTAYSSLLRLKTIPFSGIKVDQSFVRGLPQHPEHLVFIQSLRALARGLGVHLVVEGVESLPILQAMQVLKVQRVQGYAIARPMPGAALAEWLGRWQLPELPTQAEALSFLAAYAYYVRALSTLDALIQNDMTGWFCAHGFSRPLRVLALHQGLDDHHPLLIQEHIFIEALRSACVQADDERMPPLVKQLKALGQEVAALNAGYGNSGQIPKETPHVAD
ncbi:EAL domain-containing protein [Acidithiobacillus sp.]|jgi:EAL domain-containing protein (putative c-di-GMP-specific phosphodiesterase class I)|uniref:EAL domain-containing protein n=1 Tax=Acidithiobacillus sp. TaxID=1872118 RepID=UPI0025B8C6FE|nr:EAL domain-containing protein [Acidithiobacillus sp.]MCK9187855.1 EAL domain-containing protein [Acidithiobacillus sp.]MCK9358745.1 EAL domain-containing protein [Acidithiobacillus sp.]